MKKLVAFVLCFLMLSAISAQEKKTTDNKRSLLALSVGPAFPVGDFASKDPVNNAEAGFAKTGYNFSLQYRYRIQASFGVGAAVMFASHNLDVAAYPGITADHWQYLNVMVGPYISIRLNDDARVDLKSLFGLGYANAPKMTYNDVVALDEQWSSTVAVQLGANLRYNFGKNLCLLGSVDYNALKPSFKYPTGEGSTSSASQKLNSVGINVGLGVRF